MKVRILPDLLSNNTYMKKIIYLNAGHSTVQPGVEIKGYKYKTESELNMAIRDALLPELIANGFEVKLVPDKLDLTGSYKWVNSFAKKVNDGLALSIHNNCCGGKGAESFYYKWNFFSKGMAKKLINAYCIETGRQNRGAKSDTTVGYGRLGWIRSTNCWALLIETGFVDNDGDMDYMNLNMESIARGLAKGICAIYKIDYNELKPLGELTPHGEALKKQLIDLNNQQRTLIDKL